MRRQATLLAALATGATALLTLGVTAASASASASTGHGPSSRPLPYQVFAPYYDRFTGHHDLDAWIESLLVLGGAHGLRGRRVLDVDAQPLRSLA